MKSGEGIGKRKVRPSEGAAFAHPGRYHVA